MTTKSDLHTVTSWLSDLANLTAGTMPLSDSKAKIAAMASVLADDFPPGAFCRRSLGEVAAKCARGFPNYGEALALLNGWWQAHRPPVAAIAAPPTDHYERYNIPPPRTPPTEAEIAATAEIVAAFRREVAARQVSAAISAAKPMRPPAVVSPRQLLAAYEALGETGRIRAAALRKALEAVSP